MSSPEIPGSAVDKIRKEVEEVLAGLSLELVDVSLERERGRLFLRISIDKDGGVGIRDCSDASELLDKILDKEDLIRESYTLEVMSPGVNRPLRDPRDFKRFQGEDIRVKVREPSGNFVTLEGRILSVEEEGFVLDRGGKQVTLAYADLEKANLNPRLPW